MITSVPEIRPRCPWFFQARTLFPLPGPSVPIFAPRLRLSTSLSHMVKKATQKALLLLLHFLLFSLYMFHQLPLRFHTCFRRSCLFSPFSFLLVQELTNGLRLAIVKRCCALLTQPFRPGIGDSYALAINEPLVTAISKCLICSSILKVI